MVTLVGIDRRTVIEVFTQTPRTPLPGDERGMKGTNNERKIVIKGEIERGRGDHREKREKERDRSKSRK